MRLLTNIKLCPVLVVNKYSSQSFKTEVKVIKPHPIRVNVHIATHVPSLDKRC